MMLVTLQITWSNSSKASLNSAFCSRLSSSSFIVVAPALASTTSPSLALPHPPLRGWNYGCTQYISRPQWRKRSYYNICNFWKYARKLTICFTPNSARDDMIHGSKKMLSAFPLACCLQTSPSVLGPVHLRAAWRPPYRENLTLVYTRVCDDKLEILTNWFNLRLHFHFLDDDKDEETIENVDEKDE